MSLFRNVTFLASHNNDTSDGRGRPRLTRGALGSPSLEAFLLEAILKYAFLAWMPS